MLGLGLSLSRFAGLGEPKIYSSCFMIAYPANSKILAVVFYRLALCSVSNELS
jgi:hypothetical protein